MALPLLLTKLYIPPAPARRVARPRLVERLNDGLQRKLTLISASAGFGKTTLVSDWAADCKQPVAWLSLDEGDNDLARFLTYLIAALQGVSAGLGAGVQAALQAPQPPASEPILTTLLNEIAAISGHFTLVLDDYHVIDARPVDEALTFLLEHLPPQMHLLITTREDPSLSLARYRARGQLAELRTADLRFTAEEASAFLNQVMGLNVAAGSVAALETRTEGWITGLQLAALAMQGLSRQGQPDSASFIQSFTGSHHYVLDYLVEEVLGQQPENIQTFLLRTSILERLCGPLCEAVLDAPAGSLGQSTLEYLERANLFIVPLDNERKWYRYHHLFADLLRQRLLHNAASGKTETNLADDHIRASAWFERQGLEMEAFQHAAAANDVERVERLVEGRSFPKHQRGVAMAVLSWLGSLPVEVLNARPQLWVRSATLALVAGQTAGVAERLQAAESALSAATVHEPDGRTRDLLGQVACAWATLALTRYDPKTMLVQAQRALEYLDPENWAYRYTANWALASASILLGDRATAIRSSQEGIAISQKSGELFSIILAATNLARVQESENQLRQAAETYQHVLALSGEHPLPSLGDVHLGLARIYYQWNDLETAGEHGRLSLELNRQFDRKIDRFILSEIFLAQLKLAQGDADGAAAMLAQTEQTARQKNFLLRLPEIAAAQVSVLLGQGRLAEAEQLAGQFDIPLSRARVYIAQGRPSAALEVLEPYLRQMEARAWVDEQLRALLLRALALHLQGDLATAAQVLAEALALAEPGGFIRLFVDEGAPAARLLRDAAASGVGAHGVGPEYLRKLLAALDASEGEPGMAPVQPRNTPEIESAPAKTGLADSVAQAAKNTLTDALSQRELEVLRLVAEGLSNQEISERLFLALDTVKGHNRRIFEKLQVQRRTEAIARARELGLL